MTPALTQIPEFPVYGLSASIPCERWLDGWTAQNGRRGPQRLWQVDLAHGDRPDQPDRPDAGRRRIVVVVSDAKLRATTTGQPSTGLRDVALRALRGAYSLTGLSANAVALQGENARFETGRPLDELGWIRFRAVVESQTREFLTRTVGLAWAAAVDLGEVAVGMYGIGATVDECILARVNDRLADYQPLPAPEPVAQRPTAPELTAPDFQQYSIQRVAFVADRTAEPALGRPRHQRVR
jgi:hypothetical protein